jgi:hypothetical protein
MPRFIVLRKPTVRALNPICGAEKSFESLCLFSYKDVCSSRVVIDTFEAIDVPAIEQNVQRHGIMLRLSVATDWSDEQKN